MPLILEDECTRFSGRQIILPQNLVDHLKQQQNLYSDKQYKTSKGYKRLNALLSKNYNNPSDKKDRQHNDKYTISFADVKRMDFDIRHMPQNSDNVEYSMIGGDMMRDFLHNTLDSLRNSVKEVQPVPEVPKLETNDTKPEKVQNIVKVGQQDVRVENVEFVNKIKRMI
jgi:hypothetical protein